MKYIFKLILGLALLSQMVYAQEIQRPFIEVTGYAEREIVPDEIYLSITIRERESGRDEISVEQQEKELKLALQTLGIPLESLTVSDAQADYIRVTWIKKDVIAQSEYELKLSNAQEVASVFEKLDELKIHSVYIARVSHSKIKEYQKEVEVEAIKAAKEKAVYLLAAIGQEVGAALAISQREASVFIDGVSLMEARVEAIQYRPPTIDKTKSTIEFRKIKLEVTIHAKFEIK